MSFLSAYKRLDNLCKDLLGSDTGATSYIEAMRGCDYSTKSIAGWDKDLELLVKYRHIRNQIAHENDVDEADLCTESDEMWLEQFHARILNRQDPLALYYQAHQPAEQGNDASPDETYADTERRYSVPLLMTIGIVLLLLGVGIWFLVKHIL